MHTLTLSTGDQTSTSCVRDIFITLDFTSFDVFIDYSCAFICDHWYRRPKLLLE